MKTRLYMRVDAHPIAIQLLRLIARIMSATTTTARPMQTVLISNQRAARNQTDRRLL